MNKSNLTKLALAGIISGSFALTACEKSTTGGATGIAAATTLAAFEAECKKIGGEYAVTAGAAQNSCNGYSFHEGKVEKHSCSGTSKCSGAACKLPM